MCLSSEAAHTKGVGESDDEAFSPEHIAFWPLEYLMSLLFFFFLHTAPSSPESTFSD